MKKLTIRVWGNKRPRCVGYPLLYYWEKTNFFKGEILLSPREHSGVIGFGYTREQLFKRVKEDFEDLMPSPRYFNRKGVCAYKQERRAARLVDLGIYRSNRRIK